MRALSPPRSLIVAFLLHPSEDLEDHLVEVVGLVGEHVMARSSDHLTETNTQLNRRRQLFRDKAVVASRSQNVCTNLSHEHSVDETQQLKAKRDHTYHILKRLDMTLKLQKAI